MKQCRTTSYEGQKETAHGLDRVGAGRSGKETKHHGTDHPEQRMRTEFWEWGVEKGALSPRLLRSANSRNLAGRAL